MTEAILNNVFKAGNQDFLPAKRKKETDNNKSFSKIMQKINQSQQKTEKKNKKDSSTQNSKASNLEDQEFLEKLKKILRKNNKEVPSELLSLLQNSSLSKHQEAMLGQLMLNLKNNNLDISELKSILAKNNNDLNAENTDELQLIKQGAKKETLEELASLLETETQNINQIDESKLKGELDQLVKVLINLNSEPGDDFKQQLEKISNVENLDHKIAELAVFLKKSDFSSEDLAEISEQKELELPLLNQVLNSKSLNFSELEFEETLTSEDNSSLFTELSAQLKEMQNEENSKLSNQETATNVEFSDSNIFTLNNNSTLDLSFGGGELENKNQNSFFDLDNSNLLFNFELENQNTTNDLNIENFSLNSNNTADLAETADLRSQIAEQFRGEYSPETKEMQIQLEPESLGKIDISLAYDNEKLTGKMLVESEIVRAQLENSLKGLKSDLLKQGINIEQFKIETAKNAPQQVSKQGEFAFDDQNAAFSDGETGQNQEYEQRHFFQGQYYVQRQNGNSNLDNENIIMRQQEMINRAAFSNEKINLLA